MSLHSLPILLGTYSECSLSSLKDINEIKCLAFRLKQVFLPAQIPKFHIHISHRDWPLQHNCGQRLHFARRTKEYLFIMSHPPASSIPFQQEKTFSSYNQEQGKHYAQARLDYHPKVYQAVIDNHTSTGGHLGTIIDVGCGPGNAARALASHFTHVIGLDPSEGMISTARSFGGVTVSSEPLRYEISTAEELGSNLTPPIADGSVDLIAAANAAHWFDMARFWQAAARVLKPGGSVVLWTSGKTTVHPSTPNAEAIEKAMQDLEDKHLKPYLERGNLLVRNGYSDLPMPWTLPEPVPEFDKDIFIRKNWELGEEFFVGIPDANMDMYEVMAGTASAVIRWRKAHPDAVGTKDDIVKMMRSEVERLLHEAGVEKGKEVVKGDLQGVLLVVKKKA
jgi:SAM-dependent methyltransferase